MSKLADYLKRHNLKQAEFADRIGIRQSTISKLCTGATGISLQTAALIERETGGEIPASSWIVSKETGAATP